jgi:hypothetical protein
LNEAVADEGERLYGDHYMLIRIEDIALVDPVSTLKKLIKFLNILTIKEEDEVVGVEKIDGRGGERESIEKFVVDRVSEHVRGKYARAYGGNKHGTEEVKQRLIQRLQPSLANRSTTTGYHPSPPSVQVDNDDDDDSRKRVISAGTDMTSYYHLKQEGYDVVLHALRRFGYKTKRWGLKMDL